MILYIGYMRGYRIYDVLDAVMALLVQAGCRSAALCVSENVCGVTVNCSVRGKLDCSGKIDYSRSSLLGLKKMKADLRHFIPRELGRRYCGSWSQA